MEVFMTKEELWSAADIIVAAKQRYKELERYGYDWESFYNAFLEGSFFILGKTLDKEVECLHKTKH